MSLWFELLYLYRVWEGLICNASVGFVSFTSCTHGIVLYYNFWECPLLRTQYLVYLFTVFNFSFVLQVSVVPVSVAVETLYRR